MTIVKVDLSFSAHQMRVTNESKLLDVKMPLIAEVGEDMAMKALERNQPERAVVSFFFANIFPQTNGGSRVELLQMAPWQTW